MTANVRSVSYLIVIGGLVLLTTRTGAKAQGGIWKSSKGTINLSSDSGRESLMSQAMQQLLEEYLPSCFLVVFASGQNSSHYLEGLQKSSSPGRYKSMVSLDVTKLNKDNDTHKSRMIRSLRILNPKFTCRVMVMDVTEDGQAIEVLRFLEESQLYRRPNTYVVLMGPHSAGEGILEENTFRNTVNILYFTFAKPSTRDFRGISAENSTVIKNLTTGVEVFTRCLYCDGGHPRVFSKGIWATDKIPHLNTTLYPDQFADFQGHEFKIVCMDWFPFTTFARSSPLGGTVVQPLDSLDVRMLRAIAKSLNFTYEMRVPWDNQWGTSTSSGNWTGIVGTLQHDKGDFSMMLSWLENRLPVVDYSRVYASEPLVLITTKSAALSQAFALVRPFTGSLWALTISSAVIAAIVLWVLQKIWSWISGGQNLAFSKSLMLTVSILLEDPPMKLPSNVTAQMLLGWWWLYCMIVTITYRSSLIAHLTVPGKPPELNSLSDLIEISRKEKWTWGYEPTYGSGWEWLKGNDNPVVREVFQSIQVQEREEQMRRLLSGRHAFITWKYYIQNIIASRYTNQLGYTPYYTGKEEFFNFGGYGWGYRKGAPFRLRFDTMKLRLIESGAIRFWLNELIETSAAQSRIEKRLRMQEGKDTQEDEEISAEEQKPTVVLGMGHLQGVFFILLIGNGFGALSFLFETIAGALYRRTQLGS